jgi:hypothetical protein
LAAQNGETVDTIVARCFPDLGRAHVYECSAYYEDHRGEIDLLVARQMAPEKSWGFSSITTYRMTWPQEGMRVGDDRPHDLRALAVSPKAGCGSAGTPPMSERDHRQGRL